MKSVQENPCLNCSVNQRCCSQLSGLRLSKEEFEKFFGSEAERLSVLKFKNTYLVSSRENRPCPHWEEAGCKIYQDRPIDCRLYPYEITRTAEKIRSIELTFRSNPGCPQRDSLLIPIEEAKSLMEKFCRKVYGQSHGKPVIFKSVQERIGIRRCLGLLDPVMARVAKVFRRYK